MLTTAIAPELLISKSLEDLLAYRFSFKDLSQLAQEEEVPWSGTHSLFANMGGFVIRCYVPERIGGLTGSRELKVDKIALNLLPTLEIWRPFRMAKSLIAPCSEALIIFYIHECVVVLMKFANFMVTIGISPMQRNLKI
jgi:hypothetical protein